MNRSKRAAFAIVLASVSVGAPALAEGAVGFGRDGQFILSADRLFGLTFTKASVEDGDSHNKTTDSRTDISLLWPATLPSSIPNQIPRAAFDYVVASGITVGGSLGFWSGTGSTKREPAMGGVSTEVDDTSFTFWAIEPRVGYVLPIAPQFAFWPRLGVDYFSLKASTPGVGANAVTTKVTTHGFGLNIEPMFVYSPVPNFGISMGPIIDVPLSGSRSVENDPATTPNPADDTVHFFDFGLTVGLLGYF